MIFKKSTYSTKLKDLYGEPGYIEHITVDREYWCCFPGDHEIAKLTNRNWNKIKITYIRSGAVFYIVSDRPDINEHYFSDRSIMAAMLEFAILNPGKDLNIPYAVDVRFDTERTIMEGWPDNDKVEYEADEDAFISRLFDCCNKETL